MAIIKHKRKSGYVQIPNELAQNSNLSYEALGVLVNLLSRPENWSITKSQLKNDRCGDVVINRIFKELQGAGYLLINDIRQNGKIKEREWIVSDEPMLSRENIPKTLDFLNAGKPQFEETSIQGNQQLQIKNNTNKENTKKENTLCDSSHCKIIFNGFEIREPEFTEESYLGDKFPYDHYADIRNMVPPNDSKEESKNIIDILSKIVLKHFNWVTGSRFRPTNTNLALIRKCLSTGATIGNCFSVNISKFRDWKDDPVMSKYIRIKTFYALTNFEQYLGEIKTRDYRNEIQYK